MLCQRFLELPGGLGVAVVVVGAARIDALFNRLHQCGARTERYLLTDESVVANGTRRPIFCKSGITMETMRRMAEGTPVTKDTAIKICEATGRRLDDCFRKVREDHGLAEGTVKRIRTALSPIFSTAVKKELLLKNPVTNATNPRDAEVEEYPLLSPLRMVCRCFILPEGCNPCLFYLRNLLYLIRSRNHGSCFCRRPAGALSTPSTIFMGGALTMT